MQLAVQVAEQKIAACESAFPAGHYQLLVIARIKSGYPEQESVKILSMHLIISSLVSRIILAHTTVISLYTSSQAVSRNLTWHA